MAQLSNSEYLSIIETSHCWNVSLLKRFIIETSRCWNVSLLKRLTVETSHCWKSPIPENELSLIGEVLARLPVEVALGKLLLSAAVLGVLEPALTIAAGLNIQVRVFRGIV